MNLKLLTASSAVSACCPESAGLGLLAQTKLLVGQEPSRLELLLTTSENGKHHLSDPSIIARRKENLLAKFGVDNVSKIPAIKEKIIRVLKSQWQSGAVPSMNRLERSFDELSPNTVVFTGDWSYWVTWKDGTRKNPDFIVLSQDQLDCYRSGTPIDQLRSNVVIEVNGLFWHTKHKGITREEREAQFVSGYQSVGITCLVVWSDHLEQDPANTLAQVTEVMTKKKLSHI